MSWHDGSLSDVSLASEDPAPGGSPGGTGMALSAHSAEALDGLGGQAPKSGKRQDAVGTPRRGIGARLQQLLTPSRRSPASRAPPPELPSDLPLPARRSPMDSLLRPRERPGSTASEVSKLRNNLGWPGEESCVIYTGREQLDVFGFGRESTSTVSEGGALKNGYGRRRISYLCGVGRLRT